jgi:hypothetical protein
MNTLKHSRKEEITHIRTLILGANAHITEHVKWNAPSFCLNDEDRITFRLQPGDRIQLIFHRGAKPKDSSNFVFEDSSGLLEWITKDRAVVTFADMDDVKSKTAKLKKLVRRWVASS